MTTAKIIARWCEAFHPLGRTSKQREEALRLQHRDYKSAKRIFRGMPRRERTALRRKLRRETAQFLAARAA